MPRAKKPHSAALQHVRKALIGDDPKRRIALEAARLNADIARKLYELRKEADLTQTELANLVGTTASVISRLEDADYEGGTRYRCSSG
jgi:DNA-binding XRE family transcriptional regulator